MASPLPWLLATLLLAGCGTRTMRFPGPLGAVGSDAPEWEPLEAPADPPAVVTPSAPLPVAPVIPDDDAVAQIEASPPHRSDRADRADRVAQKAADAAEYYLSHSLKGGFPDNCSGLVCASYSRAGFDMNGGVRHMWAKAREAGATHHRKRPSVGDIAFFDQTYDANRNGRFDDKLTHVAVVLRVLEDGTIELAHGGTGKGRVKMWMNLQEPDTYQAADGRVLNSFMRRKRKGDPRNAKYLAGELWVGFATVRERDQEVWRPDW